MTSPTNRARSQLGDGLSGKWRYRVGDYSVLCEIRDVQLVVLAIEVGHRRDV